MLPFDPAALKVLVVEDSEHFRLLIRTVLHSMNIRDVREAADGTEALAVLREFAADLLILDYKMEPMDGISFVLKLRRSAESPNPYVPIVMVTAYAEASLVREARDAGIDEFLTKPLSANGLMTRIIGALQHRRRFVRNDTYVGPDRRRQQVAFTGPDRRRPAEGEPEAGEFAPSAQDRVET